MGNSTGCGSMFRYCTDGAATTLEICFPSRMMMHHDAKQLAYSCKQIVELHPLALCLMKSFAYLMPPRQPSPPKREPLVHQLSAGDPRGAAAWRTYLVAAQNIVQRRYRTALLYCSLSYQVAVLWKQWDEAALHAVHGANIEDSLRQVRLLTCVCTFAVNHAG
jgi:hypothetical protein